MASTSDLIAKLRRRPQTFRMPDYSDHAMPTTDALVADRLEAFEAQITALRELPECVGISEGRDKAIAAGISRNDTQLLAGFIRGFRLAQLERRGEVLAILDSVSTKEQL